jgi:hypothetical protein
MLGCILADKDFWLSTLTSAWVYGALPDIGKKESDKCFKVNRDRYFPGIVIIITFIGHLPLSNFQTGLSYSD